VAGKGERLMPHTAKLQKALLPVAGKPVLDYVVESHEGRIIEQGTHDELVQNGGQYARLFELQARGYR